MNGTVVKIVGTAVAILPVAVSTVATGATVATDHPAMWHWLGYKFEAAAMWAALTGCFMGRLWIGAGLCFRKQYRFLLDVPVTGMAFATTAAIVMKHHPEPLYALLTGAGLGVLGEGLFKLADRQLRKWMPDLFDAPEK